MPDLQDLVQHRQDILLAEVAAWLHDVGKCADAFLRSGGIGFNASRCQGNPRVNPHKAVFSPNELQQLPYWSSLSPQRGQCSRLEEAQHPTALWRTLNALKVSLPSDIVRLSCLSQSDYPSLPELILWGRPLVADHYRNFQGILGQPRTLLAVVLGWSHKIAHMEKEDEADGGQGRFIDSPFGFTQFQLQNLNPRLACAVSSIQSTLHSRQEKLRFLRESFVRAPGDTRRPINEVTLWDWSSIVTALYKAEIARCVLTNQQRQPKDIAWRLLSIRTDGLEYLLSAPSIPDLLARKDLLTDAWNRVQKVLEEEYPLGLEVYRDENGPVFVVPDLDNLLDLPNSADHHKTLQEYILEAFRHGTVKGDANLAIGGEVVPQIELSRAWSGQKDPGTGQLDLPPMGEMVAEDKTLPLQSDPDAVAQSWCHLPKPQEVCTVCGLRPQGPGKKARDRKMCDVCEERRADWAKAWAEGASLPPEERFKQGRPDTIWLDEVADKNGRVALIVGTFDLTHWLDGTLVRSLAVCNPANASVKTADEVAKNPSFARLRRVWETTRRFWQDVAPTDAPPKDLEDFCQNNGLDLKDLWEQPVSVAESLAGKVIGLAGPRLEIKGIPKSIQQELGDYHAYELRFPQGVKMAVIWDVQKKRLITAENLIYIASLLGWSLSRPWESEKEKDYRKRLHQEAAVFVRTKLVQNRVVLEEPSHYAGKRREIGSFKPEEVKEIPNSTYTPLIPILAEPRTFMALVPADKAVDVVRAIKVKYEREMGRVRNRLPLHMGIVFADAHQPLRTILDAGRRMLKQQAKPLQWEVLCSARKQIDKRDSLPPRFSADKDNQFHEWFKVTIKADKQKITWYVPAVMGDGKTEDHWYPYVFLNIRDEPSDRTRYYKAENPWSKKHPWLVHVSELRPGDAIDFTPATLDFIFLDHAGRRFELAYGPDGRRRGTLHRPYLLDELEDLIQCWKLLAGDRERKIRRLSTTQVHAVRDLMENKRTEWFEKPEDSLTDGTFRRFCESVLQNAEWQTRPTESEFAHLTHWAVTGLLADAVELFYHILKQRPEEEA